MINSKFIDNYFKFLILLFWPIVWYHYVSFYNIRSSIFMFSIFTLLSIFYIGLIIYKPSEFEKIVIAYRVFTLITFILFLCSSLILPTNIALLTLKFIFIFIYIYISYIKNFKYEMNEGIVGILSGMLLLIITSSY